jgi:hypothetical protein
MSKRKIIDESKNGDGKNEDIIIKKRQKIKFEDTPVVNSIKDLIEIGKTNKFYKNIDMIMLWDILYDLEAIDNMIGMKSLKETLFYQIIYYLQNMHEKNKGEYLHTVIYGPPGCGKCLALNTPLIMYDGSIKLVQDINVGDILMGDDSTGRNVLSLARGKEKMYRIKQTKGDDYIVNESHILSLKLINTINMYENINGKEYKKYDIVDISILDYIKLNSSVKDRLKGFKVPVEFEKKNIQFDPYIIGILLGNSLPYIGSNQDSRILKYLVQTLPKYGLYLEYKQDLEGYVIKEDNTEIILNNKYISNIYKINDRFTRLKVLAGIIDSEGYLNCDCYEIIQKNKRLADDIIFLCQSLGFYVNKNIYTEKNTKNNYNIITISGNNLSEIPVLLRRKKIVRKKPLKEYLNSDILIEPLNNDNYYGFVLDGNSRFLLGDFTVTHNTTIANIIGKLYKNLGILSSNGEFKTASRDQLCGQYLGQSAPKTKKFLQSCLGGVMFIDEAYSLGPGKADSDSFSKEVIDTMCGFLSEHKTNFCCIIAGYEKQIKSCFFSVNPGLERRFPWIHTIEEYNNDDLTEIFLKMIKDCKWFIDESVDKKYLNDFFKNNKDLFKNAGGDIETFISKCKMIHSKRVFGLDKKLKFILSKEDIKNTLELLKMHKLDKKEDSPPMFMYT